jgi:hypothetical protein
MRCGSMRAYVLRVMLHVLQSDCSSLAAPKAKPPAQNSAQMRKMINDTFARRKAEKMALPAPFSQADLEQPEAGTLFCLFLLRCFPPWNADG